MIEIFVPNAEKFKNRIFVFLRFLLYGFLVIFLVYNVAKAYCLSINAHDYGIQVGAAKNALFGTFFYCDVLNMNYLGDHFSPTLILVSPLLLLSKHPVLVLIFQNLCLIAVFFTAFKIFRIKLSRRLSEVVVLLLIPNFFIHEVFCRDYHIESFGALLFVTLIYQIVKGIPNNI